ncbi:MAG: hypothetical protein IPK13_20800 [Deltaproteobacteria bacterium]|nr:hypothetical protein [Deltaproteobacteria bacterium]
MALAATVLAAAVGLSACATQKARDGAPTGPTASAPAPVRGGQDGTTTDVRTSDLNNDGVPELTKYYKEVDDPAVAGKKKSVLVRQDIDMTWDGRVDIWRYFDDQGQVVREEWDTDYDGNVDETRFFENGVIVRSERDRNNDGRPDIFRYYAKGQLERKEVDTNGDGQIDRWEYFNGLTLDRVGVDKNFDGTVDTWAKVGTEQAAATPSAP